MEDADKGNIQEQTVHSYWRSERLRKYHTENRGGGFTKDQADETGLGVHRVK